jgi:hypothetical protein
MLSDSGGRSYFCAGAMGLRPTKLQSGAKRGFAGSHGSHRQSSDTSKERTRCQKEASGLLTEVRAHNHLTKSTIGQGRDRTADLPGGSSGLLCKDCKAKGADNPVYKVDAASSPNCAAMSGRPPRNWTSGSPQPAARHGEPAQGLPADAAPPDGRPRLDGVICGSRIRAVRGQFTISPVFCPARPRRIPGRITAQAGP